MAIDEIFDLPAHPLIVHGAVVLIPLAAFGALLCLSPRIRRHLGIAVFALALAGTGAVFLAQESGEALKERVDETDLVDAHTGMGTTLLPWAIGLTVAMGALLAIDRVGRRESTADATEPAAAPPGWVGPAGIAVSVLLVVGAFGSMERVARIGHSGAKAAWTDVDLNGGPAGIVEDDDDSSGSGSGEDDDDSSGSGSGEDDDDSSGSGSGEDDDDSSGSGSSGSDSSGGIAGY